MKKRKNYEGQAGERNPVKAFYAEISDVLIGTENNNTIGKLLPKYWNKEQPRDKEGNVVDTNTLKSLVEQDELNPENFHTTTGKWCASITVISISGSN